MGLKVLVVDNNAVVRNLIGVMLGRGGHEVIAEADDAETAWEIYVQRKPDLVTLDLSLTDSNGLDFLKRIRTADKEVRVLVISANAQQGIIEDVLAAGASGYLLKPFVYVDFEKAVNGCFPK